MTLYIVSGNSCESCYEGPSITVYKSREEIVSWWISEYCGKYVDPEVVQERLKLVSGEASAEDILMHIKAIEEEETEYYMDYVIYEV